MTEEGDLERKIKIRNTGVSVETRKRRREISKGRKIKA